MFECGLPNTSFFFQMFTLQIAKPEFTKEFCLRTLQNFLNDYESRIKVFNREKLNQAKSSNPKLFKDSAKNCNELLVEWFWPDNEVTIAGPRIAVEAKVLQYEESMDPTISK